MLDAAALLQDAHSEIQIVLVGDGAQEEHIRHRVEEEGVFNVHVFPMESQLSESNSGIQVDQNDPQALARFS